MDVLGNYVKLFADLAAKKAAVGWFPSSVYPTEEPVENAGDSEELTKARKKSYERHQAGFLGKYQSGGAPVAAVAFLQEFGSKKIPARPFMRPTITKQSKHWGVIVSHLIKPDAQAEDVVELIGLRMQGDIREAIVEVTSPALSEFTLEQRQARGNSSEKPLNDTGYMMATLTSVVQG